MKLTLNIYSIVVIYLVTSILLYLYLPQEYLIAYLSTVFLWFVVFFFKKHKNEIFCEKCANEIAEVIGMAKLKAEGENEQKVVDKAVDWIRDN